MMRGMAELDRHRVLSMGGWDARYAVTLAVASRDDVGAALIDSNGDEVDIDLDRYGRGADGVWQEGDSSAVGDEGSTLSDLMAAIWGRTSPGLVVEIGYGNQSYSVVASETGWWLFVARAAPSSQALPVVVGERRP